MLSKMISRKQKEKPEPIQMSEMTEINAKKQLLLERSSSILLTLEKMIDDKKNYLSMLDNNTEYKQKMGENDDKLFKGWIVYSYPDNVTIDERGRIYRKIWDLEIDKIDSVKQFKKEYLYDTLNPKFSSYNFNDKLLLEIEQFKNNMFAEGKRKRKRKREKQNGKNLKEKKQKENIKEKLEQEKIR